VLNHSIQKGRTHLTTYWQQSDSAYIKNVNSDSHMFLNYDHEMTIQCIFKGAQLPATASKTMKNHTGTSTKTDYLRVQAFKSLLIFPIKNTPTTVEHAC